MGRGKILVDLAQKGWMVVREWAKRQAIQNQRNTEKTTKESESNRYDLKSSSKKLDSFSHANEVEKSEHLNEPKENQNGSHSDKEWEEKKKENLELEDSKLPSVLPASNRQILKKEAWKRGWGKDRNWGGKENPNLPSELPKTELKSKGRRPYPSRYLPSELPDPDIEHGYPYEDDISL